LNDGYKIFLPNLPQPEYHFTNYVNGFLEALKIRYPSRSDFPALQEKLQTGTNWSAPCTPCPSAPRKISLTRARASQRGDVASAHQPVHARNEDSCAGADWNKFGLKRFDLASQEACDASNGPLPAGNLRLDGPRLSLRRFRRQNLRHAPAHGLAKQRFFGSRRACFPIRGGHLPHFVDLYPSANLI